MKKAWSFLILCIFVLAFVSSAAYSAGILEQDTLKQSHQEAPVFLPVTGITLFSSGLGYFEHTGDLVDSGYADLYFKTNDINDLLKSMVLQDLDGGYITSVNYASTDSEDDADLNLDLSSQSNLLSILSRTLGKEVFISTYDDTSGIRGLLLSIEERTAMSGTREPWVNLLIDTSIRSIQFSDIKQIRYLDPVMETWFSEALADLQKPDAPNLTRVSLRFDGEGQRRVMVGYLLPTPVWKTTYRIVLEDEGDHYLQGWAIVRNTTDDDWKDVSLSLVSGRPVSFIMDLNSPVYIPRPRIAPPVGTTPGMRAYEKAVPSPAPSLSSGLPSAPQAAESYRGYELEEFPVRDREIDLGRGVESAAGTEQAGEFYRYNIEHPVSLGSNESAMVPIVAGRINGTRYGIYNAAIHPVHPYNSAELENTTGVDLLSGPVTLFESNTYAGEAILNSLGQDEKQMISYSLDLDTRVSFSDQPVSEELVYTGIAGGQLILRNLYRRERSYRVESSKDRPHRIIIEHPKQSPWELALPDEPYESTENLYRFLITSDDQAEGPHVFTLVLERKTEQTISLMSTGESSLKAYMSQEGVKDAVRNALGEILVLRAAITETVRLAREEETARNRIHQEQSRIRENIARLEKDTDLYNRYLRLLDAQETQLEVIREKLEELARQERTQRQGLLDFIEALEIE